MASHQESRDVSFRAYGWVPTILTILTVVILIAGPQQAQQAQPAPQPPQQQTEDRLDLNDIKAMLGERDTAIAVQNKTIERLLKENAPFSIFRMTKIAEFS